MGSTGRAAATGKALIVATSSTKMGDYDTGAWSEEITGPYYAFGKCGYETTVCTIAGGDVPIEPVSLQEHFKTDNDDLMMKAGSLPLKGTPKLSEVDIASFDIIFLAGGHGACVDFPTDEVGAAISKACAAGRVIAAVCHGPMAFLKAKNADGSPLVRGKRMTCFSDQEETKVGLQDKVPFLLESKLRELGAQMEVSEPAKEHAMRDGRLITGQNYQSSVSAAMLAMEAAAPNMSEQEGEKWSKAMEVEGGWGPSEAQQGMESQTTGS